MRSDGTFRKSRDGTEGGQWPDVWAKAEGTKPQPPNLRGCWPEGSQNLLGLNRRCSEPLLATLDQRQAQISSRADAAERLDADGGPKESECAVKLVDDSHARRYCGAGKDGGRERDGRNGGIARIQETRRESVGGRVSGARDEETRGRGGGRG